MQALEAMHRRLAGAIARPGPGGRPGPAEDTVLRAVRLLSGPNEPGSPLTASITDAGLRLRNSGNQAKSGYGSLSPP